MTVAPVPTPRRTVARSRGLALVLALALIAVALLVRYDAFQGSKSTSGLVGSGVAAAQSRSVPSFEAVDLAGASNLTIRVGGEQRVVVHADDNLIGLVETGVRAGTLVVATRGSFTTGSPMNVDLVVPSLHAVSLTGSGLMIVTGVHAKRLTIRLPGSGTLNAGGAAERLDVSLSGSGTIQLGRLIARDVTATLSGSGTLQVLATRTLQATVSGTGSILYRGNPDRVVESVTGTGAVVGQ